MDRLPKALPKLEWRLITPEFAGELLQRNTRNRTLNVNRLGKMIGDVEAGLWDWRACVTVIVGTDDQLLDGQKTLTMIQMTGVPQPVVYITGADPDAWLAMDNVQPRSLGQNLNREAVPNANIAAGMARAIWQGANDKVIGGRESASQPILERLYRARRKEIDRRAVDAQRINLDLQFGSPSVLGAIMVMCDEIDGHKSSTFYEDVERGNREKGSSAPVAQFLRHIDTSTKNALKTRRGPDTVRHAAYLILAFNAFRHADRSTITWNPARDEFPQLLG